MNTASRVRPRWARFASFVLLALTACCALAQAPARYQGVDRIVVFGDVHGAYERLVSVLQSTGVVNAELQWSGGRTHLVSLGDLVDRGARSREVMELLMGLQPQAEAAGGRVIVLVGNHDAMNVSGELRYVSNEEYAAFAGDETAQQRDAAYQRWAAARGLAVDESTRAKFNAEFPPGFFAHRAAFAPDGRYGRWILSRPMAVVINDTAFVHGGLPDGLPAPEELNPRLSRELEAFSRARNQLADAGILEYKSGFSAMMDAAEASRDSAPSDLVPVIDTLLENGKSLVFSADGPLWYRGTARCHPYTEVFHAQPVLERFGARRVALGHTPTVDGRIHERMDGRVYLVDTGMLEPVYEGEASALVIENGTVDAVYATAEDEPIGPLPRQVGDRPRGLDDDWVERALAQGRIVSKEDVGEGVTKPVRVTVEHDGVQVQAIFKTESTEVLSGRSRRAERSVANSDRWQYEVAAYRLDRLLDLNLVPVTVERTIDGRTGSLQFWVGDIVSELKRQEEDIPAKGWCSLSEQWWLMYVFDALIHNSDRTLQNVVYDADSWMLYLIDHSRSFRLEGTFPPDLAGAEPKIAPALQARLAALDDETLHRELSEWLTRDQIRAVLKRRDRILEVWVR
ncbi:MAG: metallophosphoesterase [Gammaproteobacteria bacterium]